MRIVIALATLAATLAADMRPSEAQSTHSIRPWCIQDAGRRGILDCTYHNLWQCQQSARGLGACVENPELGWARKEQQQQRRKDWQRR